MNNKLIAGIVAVFALLIAFAVGRFTASPVPLVKDTGDEAAGKPKPAVTKRTVFKMPNGGVLPRITAPEPQAEPADTNRFGRGRGRFDPVAYVAMMKERAVTERTNLFTNASLTPAQQQDFDDLVNTMNSAFMQRSAKLLALAKDGKPLSAELNYQLLHDYSSTMMHAYEMMDHILPPDWREKAGNDFNMRNFMDPELRMATRGFRGGPTGGPGGGPGGPPPTR